MLKSVLFAAPIIAALASSASAEILFDGVISVTSVTQGCSFGGYGDLDNARYHPAAAPGNSNFSALNRITRSGATSWALRPGKFNSSFKQVTNVSIGWSDYTPDKPSFVLVSSQVPATITQTTPSITLTGKVRNPYGETGQETCVISFVFVGTKVPPQ